MKKTSIILLTYISSVCFGTAKCDPLSLASYTRDETPTTWNLYEGYHEWFDVPYASPVAFGSPGLPAGLRMNATIAGKTIPFQIDTGSRGIAVSRNLLPSDFSTKGRAGHLFYWSSGIRLNGKWIETEVTLPDAVHRPSGISTPAKATLPILVVDTVTCVAAPPGKVFPNHCTDPGVTKPATNNTMMGVGFDRTGHGDTPNTNRWNQQFNPFLNMNAMRDGAMRAGYILTPQGVKLGLTAMNTANSGISGQSVSNYAFQKLIPTGLKQVSGSPPDWQAPTGFVSLNGSAYPVGQAVVDTGIDDMLLTLPNFPSFGTLSTGIVNVSLLNSNGHVGYSFNISDVTDPLTPASVTWSPFQSGRWSENRMSRTFVNTGVRALNAFNFLYDGTDGYIGLQLNGVSGKVSTTFASIVSAKGSLRFSDGFRMNLPMLLEGSSTLNISGTVTLDAPVSGSGGLTLKGRGTLDLACAATYKGVTTVGAGTTLIYSHLSGKLRKMPGGKAIHREAETGNRC